MGELYVQKRNGPLDGNGERPVKREIIETVFYHGL